MRKRVLLILIVLSVLIFGYAIYTKILPEQNEEFFHSKMLLSVKDLPNGYHIVDYGPRSKLDSNFAEEAKKLKWEGGHRVMFSNGFNDDSTFISDYNSIYSPDDINQVVQNIQSKWLNTFVGQRGEVWSVEKVDIPDVARSIGDYQFILVGNSSLNGVQLRSISFEFIKGRVYNLIYIVGPSESVYIEDSIRLAGIVNNFINNTNI
jgi:hypothetical protein